LPAHIRPPTPPPPRTPPPARERSLTPEETTPEPPALVYKTELNAFGIYREYTYKPQHDPEEFKTLKDHVDPIAFPLAAPSTNGQVPSAFRRLGQHDSSRESQSSSRSSSVSRPSSLSPSRSVSPLPDSTYAPLRNASEFHLLHWQSTHASSTSNLAINSLVHDVIHAPGFSPSHFPSNFTIEGARERLEKGHIEDEYATPLSDKDGWIKTSVKVCVPKEGVKHPSEESAPEYHVKGVYVRDLLAVVEGMYGGKAAADFHWVPHKTYWRRPEGTSTDVPSPQPRTASEPSP
ncbi:hypothetical protein LXA43DRAFT_855048, partial [Ganoderma leucocontextum]